MKISIQDIMLDEEAGKDINELATKLIDDEIIRDLKEAKMKIDGTVDQRQESGR